MTLLYFNYLLIKDTFSLGFWVPASLSKMWIWRGKISGRCFATPTIWLPKNRLVRLRCLYSTKSEPIFKIVITSVPRALRASVRSTELSKNGKCGRTQIQSGRDFAKAIFWGKDFAKISADSF